MRLRHPQQLLVHAPIASYYQYPRAIPVSAAPELQLYILLHFRRRVERGRHHQFDCPSSCAVARFRRKGRRGEAQVGQSFFFYKDKGSALLAHKLILAECGPSRTWVIIQEVTKVLKENEATSLLHSVQGSNYARHYKRRMGDVRGSRAGDIRACDCVADRRCLSDSEVLSSIHT